MAVPNSCPASGNESWDCALGRAVGAGPSAFLWQGGAPAPSAARIAGDCYGSRLTTATARRRRPTPAGIGLAAVAVVDEAGCIVRLDSEAEQ